MKYFSGTLVYGVYPYIMDDNASELIKLSSSESIYGTLANFEFEKKIGKGQFSVVHRARCKIDQAVVALKKVQIFEMMDSKARLDCMKEINLLQVSNCMQKDN